MDQQTPTPAGPVPNFDHIAVMVFENHEFGSVIGNSQMPNFNQLAQQYTLLSQYYAVRHPSLPNYIALIGGDTFGITTDCGDCLVDETSLPDLIEASGRTWKDYQENMPEPCYLKDTLKYYRKHNPFIYFLPIRNNQQRCTSDVVPLDQLTSDLANNTLPNYMFIMPDICNSAHDCSLKVADAWLGDWVNRLMSNPEMAQNGLLVITWDEGQGDHTCCGLPTGGGRVATLLISSKAQPGFEDTTPYTHYSLLKTILTAWNLPDLGHTANSQTALIELPWQK